MLSNYEIIYNGKKLKLRGLSNNNSYIPWIQNSEILHGDFLKMYNTVVSSYSLGLTLQAYVERVMKSSMIFNFKVISHTHNLLSIYLSFIRFDDRLEYDKLIAEGLKLLDVLFEMERYPKDDISLLSSSLCLDREGCEILYNTISPFLDILKSNLPVTNISYFYYR